ncbi:MAG: glycoside hydrolase family 30 beta sandwich domain-containing protein [Eubacteriales bacterium]
MKWIETLFHDNEVIQKERNLLFSDDINQIENEIINLYPEETFQTLLGFGGAFTEAAGFVYANLSKEKQREIVNAYFGTEGLGYTLGRCAVDSCDFSLGNYSAVTDAEDESLKTFSLERDGIYVFPLLRDAKALCPVLSVMLSPWSPPDFMKTNGSKNGGGKLLPQYRTRWAEYLCRYIEEYRRLGFPVFALSVQNEPNASQIWDSCQYSPEEEKVFIRDFLAPLLSQKGFDDIFLTVWDHNKERLYERTSYICTDESANAAVGAAGFHWYSGDHFEAIELVHKRFPEKKLIFTEGCIEYSKFDANAQLKNAQKYAHELIGDLNAGLHAFLDWNICLDKNGGPNHVGNYCEAPVMADIESGNVKYNLSYFYLGHFTKYILPGAVRIGLTRYTDTLEATAFRNMDGTTAVVVFNPGNESRGCSLRLNEKICTVSISPGSISTFLISSREE